MICETGGPERLGALLHAARVHNFDVELAGVEDHLRLRVDLGGRTVDVRCVVRVDDAERLWFMTVLDGTDRPIAPASDITGALVMLKGLRAVTAG